MNDHEDAETRNTLLVAGGAALMVLGAGLIMAHPRLRRTVLANLMPMLPMIEGPLKDGVSKALPDMERYLKMRAM